MSTASFFFASSYAPLIVISLLLLAGSAIAAWRGIWHLSAWLLFGCALLSRIFIALQDPYLHEWDERFHALVARNMMDAPLRPVLVKYPVIRYHPAHWTFSHVWLHKPPLFLWQMALSMKILGISVFATRMPSALLGALMCPMLFFLTKRVTGNYPTAWLAAAIMCFSGFQHHLIGGQNGMDHNDVAFGFYVLASLLAYMHHTRRQNIASAMLVGFLVGGAVMVKWLVGMVVLGAWACNIFFGIGAAKRWNDAKHWLIATATAMLVVVPWHVYTFCRFPVEAAVEMQLNNRHVMEVVEHHSGTIFFYVDNFPKYFGEVGWPLAVAGFVLLLRRCRTQAGNNAAAASCIATFSAVFIFFSYVAATKGLNYLFVVAPIGMMCIAITCMKLKQHIHRAGYPRTARTMTYILFAAILVSIFNPD